VLKARRFHNKYQKKGIAHLGAFPARALSRAFPSAGSCAGGSRAFSRAGGSGWREARHKGREQGLEPLV